MTNGWEVIRLRNERMARAEAMRKSARAQNENTGSVRLAAPQFRYTVSFLEMILEKGDECFDEN